MFLNVNGVIAKKLRKVNGVWYKVANQALYPENEKSEAIYNLELLRASNHRICIQSTNCKQIGYIRHVEIDGEKYTMLFAYKTSKIGKQIDFPIVEIKYSNSYFLPNPIYKK